MVSESGILFIVNIATIFFTVSLSVHVNLGISYGIDTKLTITRVLKTMR